MFAFLGSCLKWFGLILRIALVFNKLYPHIVTALEVIKEEVNNGAASVDTKRDNVANKLLANKNVDIASPKLNTVINGNVASLKKLGSI